MTYLLPRIKLCPTEKYYARSYLEEHYLKEDFPRKAIPMKVILREVDVQEMLLIVDYSIITHFSFIPLSQKSCGCDSDTRAQACCRYFLFSAPLVPCAFMFKSLC